MYGKMASEVAEGGKEDPPDLEAGMKWQKCGRSKESFIPRKEMYDTDE